MLTSAVDESAKPDREALLRDPRVPKPTGHKLLVWVPPAQEKTTGGILLPDKERDLSQVTTPLAYVIAVGPDAYADHRRFPSGAFCKAGDWIIMPSMSGGRLKLQHGKGDHEFRLINDDTVLAVVDDPTGLRRG